MGYVNPAQPPRWAIEMLDQARVAHLGMIDTEGRPRVLPVTFALAEGRIWSAIDDKPKRDPERELARLRFLRREPRAALTVDRYSEDWEELAWVQALGEVEIAEAADTPAALDALALKYEQYRKTPPAGPLLALRPERWISWRARG